MSLLQSQARESLMHEVRLRLRARPLKDRPLIVFEGSSDVSAYRHFIDPDVPLHPAGGRDRVLNLFEDLQSQPEFQDVLFLIDCDNDVPRRLKGRPNLVISENRDLECDLIVTLRGLERFIVEHCSSSTVGLQEAKAYAILVGRIKDAARGLSLPTKQRIAGHSRRVRVPMAALAEIWGSPKTESRVEAAAVRTFGRILGWARTDMDKVAARMQEASLSLCACSDSHCVVDIKRFCNGHDLFELCYLLMCPREAAMDQSTFERSLRMGASDRLVESWVVGQRLRAYEDRKRMTILNDRVRWPMRALSSAPARK